MKSLKDFFVILGNIWTFLKKKCKYNKLHPDLPPIPCVLYLFFLILSSSPLISTLPLVVTPHVVLPRDAAAHATFCWKFFLDERSSKEMLLNHPRHHYSALLSLRATFRWSFQRREHQQRVPQLLPSCSQHSPLLTVIGFGVLDPSIDQAGVFVFSKSLLSAWLDKINSLRYNYGCIRSKLVSNSYLLLLLANFLLSLLTL